MPRNVTRFERLMYLALVFRIGADLIDLVRGVISGALTVKVRAEPVAAIGYAFIALLIWLAARRGKKNSGGH
jgi:hypothetical protein